MDNWTDKYQHLLYGAKQRFLNSEKQYLVVGMDENHDFRELFLNEIPNITFFIDSYKKEKYLKVALFELKEDKLNLIYSYDMESQIKNTDLLSSNTWKAPEEILLEATKNIPEVCNKYLILTYKNNEYNWAYLKEADPNIFLEKYEIEKIEACALYQKNGNHYLLIDGYHLRKEPQNERSRS